MKIIDFVLPTSEKNISDRIAVELDTTLSNTLWVTMKKDPTGATQNFSLPLLHHLSALIHTIKEHGTHWHEDGNMIPIHYAVMRSEHPDYFSLGGDLNYFRNCIRQHDKSGLYHYSKLCLDMMYDWATSSSDSMTTIALVQGRALGGGFEAALSADFLIAEEHSEFGFPEIMFGLFPCTGGMSLLARRVGVHQAERMMTNARIYCAAELKEMGVIDEICPSGEGNLAVTKFISNHAKRRVPRLMIQRSRHRIAPLDYAELLAVVNEWVDVAMALPAAELRVMDMLIMMQAGARKSSVDLPHETRAHA
ncbi:MAG TPA: crotonase/enoyl-CoA hydratase family protein [Herbaspirillum sp.]|nr:crotonase/enoyl-CoA hydratase family protein [Herbaspirillum sp.]